MPFDWLHTPARPQTEDRFRDQHLRAIRERARLFYNLGLGADEAAARIQRGLDWELDTTVWPKDAPAWVKDVKKVVDEVYDRCTAKGC